MANREVKDLAKVQNLSGVGYGRNTTKKSSVEVAQYESHIFPIYTVYTAPEDRVVTSSGVGFLPVDQAELDMNIHEHR